MYFFIVFLYNGLCAWIHYKMCFHTSYSLVKGASRQNLNGLLLPSAGHHKLRTDWWKDLLVLSARMHLRLAQLASQLAVSIASLALSTAEHKRGQWTRLCVSAFRFTLSLSDQYLQWRIRKVKLMYLLGLAKNITVFSNVLASY